MISPSREEDRAIRLTLMEAMATCTKLGLTEHVKEIGRVSRQFAENIKSKDYTREDLHAQWLQKREEWKNKKIKDHPGTFDNFMSTLTY